MNMTDMVIFVITLTLTECSEFIAPENWVKFEDNEYYKIQLNCYYAGTPNESNT